MPAIGSNGLIARGIYVVRFNSPRYSPLRSACWYAWARANQATVGLLTRPWDPPERTGFEYADQKALQAAQLWEETQGDLPPNKVGLDGDVYQGFVVRSPTPFWDYRGECGFAAWPWDGAQDLEVAATGTRVTPYHELDAAVDAVESTAGKALDVATDIPGALDSVGSAMPLWVKVMGTVAGIGVIGYTIRAVRR